MYRESTEQANAAHRPAVAPTILSVEPNLDVPSILRWLRDSVSWPGGLSPEHARLRRFWAGRNGRISFELEIAFGSGSGRRICTLQGMRGAPPKMKLRPHAPSFDRNGCRGYLASSDALGIWMCSSDRDPYLPAVVGFLDVARLPASLNGTAAADYLGVGDLGARFDVRLSAHRITKRCAMAIERRSPDSMRGTFIKTFRRPVVPGQIAAYRAVAEALCNTSDGTIQTPRVLDCYRVESSGVMITEHVPAPAAELGRSRTDTHSAAHLLASLHAIRTPVSKTHNARNEIDTVHRWLVGLESTGRTEAGRVSGMLDTLRERSETLPPARATVVHRDFHRAQVLRSEGGIWLLDLDTLSQGDQEVDLAAFMAHLLMDATRSGAVESDTIQEMKAFLREYRARGGSIDDQRLKFYLPCALCRLGALHLLRGQSRRVIEALWANAEHLLDLQRKRPVSAGRASAIRARLFD